MFSELRSIADIDVWHEKAKSLHDRHAAERAASCIRLLNASLFTLTIRHLTYSF
jgi:hypothetical protein